MKKQMLKRKDGSVSQRGLWDNIRANKGSGKKPTTAMLKQEKKITAAAKMQTGGVTPKKKSGKDTDPGFVTGGKPTKDFDPGFNDIKNKIKNDTVSKKKKSGREIDPGFYPKPKPGQKTGKDIDPGFMPKINDSLPKRKIKYDPNGGIQFKKGGLIKKK